MYQSDPSSPIRTGALLGALDSMMAALLRTRREALGGAADARQEVITAVLSVAQTYDLARSSGVGLHLLGDVANLLARQVGKGLQTLQNEVLVADPEVHPSGGFRQRAHARLDLGLLVKKGHLHPNDPPVLLLEEAGLSRAQIAQELGLKERTVKERLAAARKRLERLAEKFLKK
jgi:hypothetical protein